MKLTKGDQHHQQNGKNNYNLHFVYYSHTTCPESDRWYYITSQKVTLLNSIQKGGEIIFRAIVNN